MKPDDSRKVKVVVISDVHLATFASKAIELVAYLKSISPEILVLNGDIIDAWRFTRNYFPKAHFKVVRQVVKMMEKGTKVHYISGNHDEILRKFDLTQLGNFHIANQLELELGGTRTWIFHGDIFDSIIHSTKWLAKFGAALYGLVSVINSFLGVFSRKRITVYKRTKGHEQKNAAITTRFEKLVGAIAIQRKFQTVICGHTHLPADKMIYDESGSVRYINCGDWVEHYTAAEYSDEEWKLVYFSNEKDDDLSHDDLFIPGKKQIYRKILEEFAVTGIL